MPRRNVRAAAWSALLCALCLRTAIAEPAADRVFLWKVEGDPGQAWLLGSIHVGADDMFPLDLRITEAFEHADELVLEIPMDPEAAAEAAVAMAQAARLPAGSTLHERIGKDTRRRLAAWSAEAGLPPGALNPFHPWAAAMAITLAEAQRAGYSAQRGIDQHFVQQRGDRPMRGLETVEENLAVFRSLSPKVSEAFLRATLIEAEETVERLEEMIEAWRQGDAEALDALVRRASRDDPELKAVLKTLLTDRNVRMAERLQAMLGEDKVYFVVVGAGHLVGDKGLPALLREAGLRVEQQ